MSKSYVCAMCGNKFECDNSDEEAIKEFEENFGIPFDTTDTELVCDYCYNAMNKAYPFAQFREEQGW